MKSIMEIFNCIFYTIIIFFAFILNNQHNVNKNIVVGDTDWTLKCKPCNCKWYSGTKSADCQNLSITKIPVLHTTLQLLDLSNNFIPEIKRKEFYEAELENLHKLSMKKCTLEEIHYEGLFGLYILIELDLSYNYLRKLHPTTFANLTKLRTLKLNNNLIEELYDEVFSNLPYLRQIELQNNKIITIGLYTFRNSKDVRSVNLDSNELTYLNIKTFEHLQSDMSGLTILDNPWNCTCELQQFQKFMNYKKLSPTTKCREPPHLNNKFWIDIPTEQFACKPIIINPMQNLTIIQMNTENVTLSCVIKGSPKPNVSWLLNRKSLYSDKRISIKNSQEINQLQSTDLYTTELQIIGMKISDKGIYSCVASNGAGLAEIDYQLVIPAGIATKLDGTIIGVSSIDINNSNNLISTTESATLNIYLIIFIIIIILLTILIIILLIVYCYCKRIKGYSNKENGNLIYDKSHHQQSQNNGIVCGGGVGGAVGFGGRNDSMLEGSVIMEMQKSLLTEVNPVEKPPRRTELDSSGDLLDDGHDLKKILLDETQFVARDDETHSLTLSDTTPRSRTTFVDDGYGTNLPPDLIAFPSTRFPQSPSIQSSMSNIPDGRCNFIKSPINSPIYSGNNPAYTGNGGVVVPQSGFRTLQHPKIARNLLNNNNINNSRSNSPFTPAPIMYTPVVMKQGYVTIPRKPRSSSNGGWTLSSPNTIAYAPISPTSIISSEFIEPVYDNLGLRTTASGNSVLSLNKIGINQPSNDLTNKSNNNNNINKYSMKDRPLPATPKIYEAIQENGTVISTVPLTKLSTHLVNNTENPCNNNDLNNSNINSSILINDNNNNSSNNNGIGDSTDKFIRIPPRPPPKPKKKKILNGNQIDCNGTGDSTSQLFQDECEDGTEV